MDEILHSMEIISELGRVIRSEDLEKLREMGKRHAKIVSSLISNLHASSQEVYVPKRGESVLYVFSVSRYQESAGDVVTKFSKSYRVLVISISRPCEEFKGVECLEHSIERRSENQFSSIPEVMILLDRYGDVELIVLDSLPALSVVSSEGELKKFIYYLMKKTKEVKRALAIFTIEGTIPSEIEAFVATLCNRTVSLK